MNKTSIITDAVGVGRIITDLGRDSLNTVTLEMDTYLWPEGSEDPNQFQVRLTKRQKEKLIAYNDRKTLTEIYKPRHE